MSIGVAILRKGASEPLFALPVLTASERSARVLFFQMFALRHLEARIADRSVTGCPSPLTKYGSQSNMYSFDS
jgi:hypothetical protein